MPTAALPVKPLTAWSFSRYNLHKQCPLKLKLTAINGLQEPKGPALVRGTAIHTMAEHYIKGVTGAAVPKELAQFAKELRRMRKQFAEAPTKIMIEEEWAFTKEWKRAGWFDRDCWVRVKLDVLHIDVRNRLIITDWKTGKFRPNDMDSYLEQMSLYALVALLMFGDEGTKMLKVRPRLMFTDHGITYPRPQDGLIEYDTTELPLLLTAWEGRAANLFNDTIFAPRPNQFCPWCHFRKANGGPCQY